MKQSAHIELLMALIAGLLIAAIGIGFWIVAAVVVLAEHVGALPFGICAGLALSHHYRLCEAHGERELRMPIARIR